MGDDASLCQSLWRSTEYQSPIVLTDPAALHLDDHDRSLPQNDEVGLRLLLVRMLAKADGVERNSVGVAIDALQKPGEGSLRVALCTSLDIGQRRNEDHARCSFQSSL